MSLAYYDFLKNLHNSGYEDEGKWVSHPFKWDIQVDIFNNAKPIVFKNIDTPISKNRSRDDLPFEYCWFEVAGKPIEFFSKYKVTGYTVKGFLASKTGVEVLIGDRLYNHYNFPDDVVAAIQMIVTRFIERFNSEFKGVSNPRQIVKIKINNKKQMRRINQVIYVSPKRQCKSFGERNIDWTYKFDVRGHWAHYQDQTTIGHDQNGNIVYGKTWRKPYVKGDESLPYIKKVRVVK